MMFNFKTYTIALCVLFSTSVQAQNSCCTELGEKSTTDIWEGLAQGPWSSHDVSLSIQHGQNTSTTYVGFTDNLTSYNASWFSESVSGHQAIGIRYVWDDTPNPATTDIDLPEDDKGTALFTFSFEEKVTDVVLHIDRLGSAGGVVGNYISNSAAWTVTTPGVTLQKLSGTSDLDVTTKRFNKTPDVVTALEGEARQTAIEGTAAGSIAIISAEPLTSISFEVTGVGIEAAGFDEMEIAITKTNCVQSGTQPFLELQYDEACRGDDAEPLLGGWPLGGTYSGVGVSGNMIDPSVAGVGQHAITYTITDVNGCTSSDTDIYEVYPGPAVSLQLPNEKICMGETLQLTGGLPAGGFFSGAGVNSFVGTFDSASAGLGTHTITYSYQDGNGCYGMSMMDIEVNDLPVTNLTLPKTQICSSESVLLSGGTPLGGTWSGPGVTADRFDANVVGLGNHTIQYTFTDSNGCSSIATDQLQVKAGGTYTAASMCYGDSYILDDGQIISEPGIYMLNNSACTDTLELDYFPITSDAESTVVYCEILNTPAGTYTIPLIDDNGCSYDSIVIVIDGTSSNEYTFIEICEDESYTWNDMTFTESGEYLNSVYNEWDCVYTEVLDLTVLPLADCTSRTSEYLATDVKLFPNPATATITVSGALRNGNGNVTAKIYDIKGKLVQSSMLSHTQSQIDIRDLPTGLYIAKFDAEGIKISQSRFVKI